MAQHLRWGDGRGGGPQPGEIPASGGGVLTAEQFYAQYSHGYPIERAAHYDGVFPLGVDTAAVARIADTVARIRGTREGFDIAVAARPGDDPKALNRAGATWAMHAFWPGHRPDQVLRMIERGKPNS